LSEKIHTIPSYLPDILLSLLALPIELAGAGRAPRAPRVPGDSDPAPTCRRSRTADKYPLRLRDTSPPPTIAIGEHPIAVFLPGSLALYFRRVGKKIPDTVSVRSVLTARPLPSGPFFFCSRASVQPSGPAQFICVSGPGKKKVSYIFFKFQ
jgi:hypothetical protein